MSTVTVIILVIVYAGPCMLFWHLGKRAGYEDGRSQGYKDGYDDGRKQGHIDRDWGIPNPGNGYQR